MSAPGLCELVPAAATAEILSRLRARRRLRLCPAEGVAIVDQASGDVPAGDVADTDVACFMT